MLHMFALLPPTLLMGASLPLLVRGMVREVRTAGTLVGYLYGINVLGASIGAVATSWLLIPQVGIRGAVLVAAAANLLVSVGGFVLASSETPAETEPAAILLPSATAAAPDPDDAEAPGGRPFGLWLVLYALSGFTALSLEVVWFRLMDVAVKSTAFTFGAVLALYLLGCGAGSLLALAFMRRVRRPLFAFLACQCALLSLAAVALLALVGLPPGMPLYRWFVEYWASYSFFPFGHDRDPTYITRLYVLLPAALFGLPTVLMGLSFPILQRAVHDDVRESGRRVGALQAANVAGCLAGSLFVSFVALKLLGTSGTLRLLMAGGLVFAAVGWRFYGRRFGLPMAILLALAVAMPGNERLWRRLHGIVDPSSNPLFDEDGTAVIALTPLGPDNWQFWVNGKGSSWLPYGGVHTLLGALPAVIHPAPRDVAIIGLGSGDTTWAASCRPETRRVTVFEIAAPQPRILFRLAAQQDLPELRSLLADPRIEIRLADGRRALEAEEARYDLIEIDATWPESAMSGNLYSIEFFTRCAQRLKPGGVMCTWAPTARADVTFRRVFPYIVEIDVDAHILVGSRSPLPLERERWRTTLRSAAGYLGEARTRDLAERIDGCRWPTQEPDGPINEDLFPRDEFASPY